MVVGEMVQEVDLVVLGAGPGGYTAALRAAELGIKTILVDAMPKPGGVCLHMGCIPSKALLHAAEVINTAKGASKFGLHFAEPKLNVEELRTWKVSVTDKLAQGIVGMCKSGGVEIVHGQAKFNDSKSLRVDCPGESAMRIKFKHCILATGSRPTVIPKLFKSEKDQNSSRIVDSTGALALETVPKSLLVVGGGYIGLEMGTVYDALGAEVTVVEMTDGLLPGVDRDLVKPLATHLSGKFKNIFLSTKVLSLEEVKNGVEVTLEGKDVPEKMTFEKVLIAVGRRPNSDNIGLENTQVTIDAQGFVTIDAQCRTSDKRILAIGDVSGQPMLAHRAMRQGMVAAEVLAGRPSSFDNRAIPAVVFTEPEIAWAGITETEAKAQGKEIGAAKFPWSAS
ncbi:MAG TPA: dihydrolipoyl dehydrogenase, partial [Candidatus Melainabacteria bacterium]|nr:dihydrolipoyl dehydrogenase [Candidatus Melainabacteria bacterium]HIN66386.1 dihydrolipoyl dehydrogenase [Candidatus Obscuribacterales bacterium]